MQDLVTKLEILKQKHKLSRLAELSGLRYQTIYNIACRKNKSASSMLVRTVERLTPAVEAIEKEEEASNAANSSNANA